MTNLYQIQDLMKEQLSDACTLKEFARRAADALEDGEALAALGFTDEDQAVIETAHTYYRGLEDAEMTPAKFTLYADWSISFDGTAVYSGVQGHIPLYRSRDRHAAGSLRPAQQGRQRSFLPRFD